MAGCRNARRRFAQAQLELEREQAEHGFLSAAERERGRADREASEAKMQELIGSPSLHQATFDDARAMLVLLDDLAR